MMWEQAYKNKNYFPMDARRDDLGNYTNVASPAYNKVSADDSLAVQRAKQAAQNRAFQNQGMMNPSNWADYASMQPGRAMSQATGEPYNYGNAIADIIGAYWANKGGNAPVNNAGVNSNYVAQALASAVPAAMENAAPALPAGSGDVLPILNNLGKFF